MSTDWMSGSPSPFTKVLVANRGEIAVRVLQAAREAGLSSVAVYSITDSSSLHVEVADEAVLLEGEGLDGTYLDGSAIIEAARSCGADAIHPGYGFLSERAEFARQVESSGITWIGPSPEAIETMGDKISARSLMIESGVPVIPGEQIRVGEGSDHLGALASAAAKVGYPLLIKASAGGGGKGMRSVSEPKNLRTEFEAAAREASAAFGDGTVYIEKMLSRARHVEIQVLCDSQGSSIHLNERDCSLQRRYQKVIEEAPSPAMTPQLREAMGEAAVTAARSVGYVGAGTVEFLLASNGEFYFLEMNTRIQVEHPVTEMTTGVDLVQKQFEIAAGLGLGMTQEQVGQNGHSIEARVYAEDPSRGFLPSTGELAVWRPPSGPGIRVDSGVREGDSVTIDFDPMLAKLVVHAPDRASAIRRLDSALSSFVVLGVRTNIDFLRNSLSHASFIGGSIDTDFLDSTDPSELSGPEPDRPALVAIAASARRLGMDRASPGPAEEADPHTGHPGDPFRTLGRTFP
ncbi:MAG: pyruvate carboxylase subunit A [Euryarchaeota archaeon]|nr:pyruvate carboxylase subunit A [Euryarchaeota archaeon]